MRCNCSYKKIKSVCSFVGDGDWIESKDQSESGIRLIQTGNIGNGVFKDKEDKAKFISSDTFSELGCTEIFEGDCLISRLPDPIGRCCILPKLEERTITAVDCTILRFNEEIIPQYFVYYSQSRPYSIRIQSKTTGSTRKRISRKNLENIDIPIPSLEEQERIVSELDKINELIRLKKEQLKDYDNLAQSIFYEMFGDPVVNEKGWEVKHIGDFGTCIAGATPSTTVEEYWINGTIPWLSSGEVSKGRIFNTDRRITQHGYDSCSTRMIPAHTIVIAMAGQGKTRGTVGVAEIPLCTNQSICSIVTNEKIDVDFLYYQIKFLYNELRSASNGDGGRGGLNLRLIQKFPIISPNYSLQVSFAKRIKTVELLKSNIQSTITDLETLLASRMQYWFD